MRRHARWLFLIIFPVLILIITRVLPGVDSQDGLQKWNGVDFYQSLNCGYIRTTVSKTIFNPAFLKLIAKEGMDAPLSKGEVENFVNAYNSTVKYHAHEITFYSAHFERIASLAESAEYGDDSIDLDDINILYKAYQVKEPIVPSSCKVQRISGADMLKLNPEGDAALAMTLTRVANDPVGNILVRNAVKRDIRIQSRSIKGPPAVCNLSGKSIVVDKTVTTFDFKIRFLVHELVHAVNPSTGNSISEETLAEVISMGVQDRITGVPLACNPYVVFVDRLLDTYYGRLPLENDMKARLRDIGIDMDSGEVMACSVR